MKKRRQQLRLRGRELQQKKLQPKLRDKELQKKRQQLPKLRGRESLQKKPQLKLKGKDWLRRWPPLSQLLKLKEFWKLNKL